MYNLLEYNGNYSMASGTLRNYYRVELNNDANENNAAYNKADNNKTITSKSRRRSCCSIKYLSSFWSSLDLPLINCEIELDLS